MPPKPKQGRVKATKKPTIVDVANLAGVSLGTVSRVLNNHTDVKPKNYGLVQSAIKRLGYRPNKIARSMRTKSTRVIGCMVTDIAQPISSEMINAAERTLWDAGYAMLISNSYQQIDREQGIFSFFKQQQVDALILVTHTDKDAKFLKALSALEVPIVLWERDAAGVFDSVLTDHGSGAEMATRHLLELGHHKIAMVAAYKGTWPGREQSKGYAKALRSFSVAKNAEYQFTQDEFTLDEVYRLLKTPKRPTAIVANIQNIPMLIKVARKLELKIPQDISLVSLGDSENNEVYLPSITAIRGDGPKVGAEGAQLVIELLKSDDASRRRRVIIPTELIIRQSTAPPCSD